MKKINKKLPILFASLAMAMGVGLVGSKDAAKSVKADTDYEIAIKGFGGDTSSGYETTTKTATFNGLSISISNYIGQSGQIRGNGNINTNFTAYNTTPTAEPIVKITLTSTGGTFTNAMNAAMGTSSQAGVQSGGVAGSKATNSMEWNFDSSAGYTYFRLYYSSTFTSGSATGVVLTITTGALQNDDGEAFIDAVDVFSKRIGSLTLEDREAVEKARAEYEKLTDELKQDEFVQYALEELEKAEAEIADLVAADEAAKVDELISAIGEVKDYSKAKQIKEAREAFEALDDAAKAKVNNKSVLEAAEKELAKYRPSTEDMTFEAGKDFKDDSLTSTKTASDGQGKIEMKDPQQNDATGAPAYNTTAPIEVRFYADKTNGNGASITFYFTGLTVKSFSLTASGASYTQEVNYYVDGGSKITTTAWSGTNLTISDLDATESIKIQNGHTGNTDQLRITTFTFTYELPKSDSVEQFVADWHAMRAEGSNGICDFDLNGENALTDLLKRFEDFGEEDKELIRSSIDVDDVTIGQTMDYINNVLKSEAVDPEMANLSSFIMSASDNTTSLVALFAILGLISVSAYYFIEKRKLAK